MSSIFIGVISYIILAIILWLLAKDYLYSRNKKILGNKQIWNWQLLISVLLIGIFYGIRYDFGPDNLMYIKDFEKAKNGLIERDNFEMLYLIFRAIFIYIDAHFSIYIGFYGLVMAILLYSVAIREKYILPFFAPFLILGPSFAEMSNVMRQYFAFCVFAFSIKYIVNKDLLRYVLCMVVCFLMHKSALILIPFYFVFQNKCYLNRKISIIVFIGCTIVGNLKIVTTYLMGIGNILKVLGYNIYADKLARFTIESEWTISWGPARILIWLMSMFAIWLFYDINKKYSLRKEIQIYYSCFFWGSCLYNLMISIDQIFLRPVLYFYDFYIFIIPLCLYYLHKKKCELKFIGLAFIAYFYSVYITVHGVLTNTSYEIYKFFFLQ